jgi:hypothetical protein
LTGSRRCGSRAADQTLGHESDRQNLTVAPELIVIGVEIRQGDATTTLRHFAPAAHADFGGLLERLPQSIDLITGRRSRR